MEDKVQSLFWKFLFTIGAWMLVLSIIQGICIYYFVSRFTANKITSQTDAINKQTDKLMEEMKNFPSIEELKALEKNIERIEAGIGIKIESMELDIIKDLTPAIKVTSQKPYYISASQIKCNYSIKNKGKYSAKITNLKFHLATTKIESPDKIKDQLKINKDYYLRTNLNVEDIAPGEEIKQDITIELINHQKIPGTIYFCVTFDAQTDPNIINAVKNIDKEKIGNKKSYSIMGDIVTPG